MKNLFTVAILALTGVLPVASLAATQDSIWVSAEVLQVKLDRIYLDHGRDECVFRNSRFVIHNGYDSIYSGCIEASYQGISYSYPTGGLFDTIPTQSLHVWVERAAVDTVSPIVIGHVGYLPRLDTDDPVGQPRAGNPVVVRTYDSPFEMSLAFEAGNLDGQLSYRRSGSSDGDDRTVARPAPFFVALVPNPASEIALNGFLTTSLYYRLDPERTPLYFDGDRIAAFNRLGTGGDTELRWFPFDPAAGRDVLRTLRTRSRKISIGVDDAMFEKIAGYYADILSRDRFLTSFGQAVAQPDLRISAIPIGKHRLASLRYIFDQLSRDTVAGRKVNETMAIIRGYLETAEAAVDSTRREHYADLAENSLRDDIGVMPLFRPTLFFTTRQSLRGIPFDSQSRPDLTHVSRVRLPGNREECGL